MKLILDIKDNKAAAFITFIKSLDFISINNEDLAEPNKQEILNGLKEGIKEVVLHESGEIELQSAKDFVNGL